MPSDPVFIVGTGRCGSTLFHDVLSHHRRFGWLSQLADRKPGRVHWNRWGQQALRYPLAGTLARRLLIPSEPYGFWEHYCRGFSRPYRDITERDLIPRVVPGLRRALGNAIPQDSRLLAKITGWPRMRYLKAVFPDARFIHIVRDGRAVVNSVVAAPYFDGWSGPGQWTRGELDERQRKAWRDSGESFVVLAAIGWENRMNAFEAAKAAIPAEDYLEIRYEDFCEDTIGQLDRALEFVGLADSEHNPRFREAARRIPVKSQNEKWRADLSEEQQQLLDDYLRPVISRYGY